MANSDTIDIGKLKGFIPFDYLSEHVIQELAAQIRCHQLDKGKILFKRGETDNECHFLIEGSLDIADDIFNITKVEGSHEDNYLALDNSSAIHRSSAITTSSCTFYSIGRDHLDLVTTWAQLAEDLDEESEDDTEHRDWMDALLTSALFTKIPPSNIQKLLVRFSEQEVTIGKVIIKEDEDGDEFYVIKEGRALVTRGEGKKEQTLAALQTGDCFGEDALIAESVRNATVTMASNGTLMVLGKQDFNELLKEPVIKRISLEELHIQKEEGDKGTVVIDVRMPQEYRHDHLKDSKNLPLNNFREQLKQLSRDFHYVVYCDGGRRSEVAAYIMNEDGFDAVCLDRS